MLASQLRLEFTALSESEVTSIIAHYKGQFGSFDSFDLPASVWNETSSPSHYQLTSYLWRYIESPRVNNLNKGYYDVSLVFETTPPDAAIISGQELIVAYSGTTGTAYAANGLAQVLTISLIPGSFIIPGGVITLALTIDGGVGAASNGAQLSAGATLTAGEAFAASGADKTISIQFTAGVVQTDDQWISMYYDFEPFPYEDATGIFLDWNPPLSAPPVAPSSYFADMSSQMFGWEGLAYIEWWGN